MSQSTISRRYHSADLKRSCVYLLPHQTNQQRISRVEFTLNRLHEPFDESLDRHFKSQFNCVHLDEKLLYCIEKAQTYYQHPFEDSPKKEAKSNRYIIKCMFLAPIARPRYAWWHGKIGMYPIVKVEQAKKNSKNRPAGTLETKCMNVTAQVYKDLIFNKVLPDINRKWC